MKEFYAWPCRQFLSRGILLDRPLFPVGIFDQAQVTQKEDMRPGKR
ncbi:MAG: hypothetical protein WCC08_14025 [Terrimicrobiaceae bacterium]